MFNGGTVPQQVTGYRMAAELEDLSTLVVNPGDLIVSLPPRKPEKLDAWYLIITDNFHWSPSMTKGSAVPGDMGLDPLTGGEGAYTMELSHYDPVPSRKQQELAQAWRPRAEEE
jgi:hypothetical protein